MFVMDNQNNSVYRWTLSTAFDTSTFDAVDTAQTFSIVSSNLPNTYKHVGDVLKFSPDGTKMFILVKNSSDASDAYMHRWTLSTAWDLTTASWDHKIDYFSYECFAWSSDGLNLYTSKYGAGWSYSSSTAAVSQWTVSVPWDLTTLVQTKNASNVRTALNTFTTTDPDMRMGNTSIHFDDSGKKIIMTGMSGTYGTTTIATHIVRWHLGTAWDLSTVTETGRNTVNLTDSFPIYAGSQYWHSWGVWIDSTGTRMYYTLPGGGWIRRHTIGETTNVAGAQIAIANTIDTSAWGDLNSYTVTDANDNIYYAVSADAKTTWNIFNNVSIRPIAKLDSGTWKYNSNATHGSETWTNASVNSQLLILIIQPWGQTQIQLLYLLWEGVVSLLLPEYL